MKRIILKFFKYSLYTLLALFITFNLFIVLSGRFYMYKGIANTYLIGKTDPTIYDLDVFPYSTVKASGNPVKFTEGNSFNKFQLSQDQLDLMKELDTKAFLVIKNGSLIFEKYWEGHDNETVSNSFSVAKTLVAMLIGIAVEEGHINSLDDKVADYLPEFLEGGKDVVTIRHLLSMSSGLDWEESGKNPFSDNAESYYGTELRRLVLGQEMESEPGKVFKYQSGNSQLLGYILEEATGVDLSEYAESRVWNKIGAEHDAYWSLDKGLGDEKAFCCMYATARDYAKLGQILLQKGCYGDEQIIPSWYYYEMIKPQVLSTEDGIPNYRYGLHTWTYLDPTGKVDYCRGINGQYIITIPSENLLIVRLGSGKRPLITMPEDKLNDQKYLDQNKFKVGHASGLFEYISIGRDLSRK